MRNAPFNRVQREFFDRTDRALATTKHQPNVHHEVVAVRRAILADNPFLILEALDPLFAKLVEETEGREAFSLRDDLRTVIHSKRVREFVEEWLDARHAFMKAERQRAAEAASIIASVKAKARTDRTLEKMNQRGIPLKGTLGSSLALQTLKTQLRAAVQS